MSKALQNFPKESQDLLNDQINRELYAAYCYFIMSNYCLFDSVALPGLAAFFKKSYKEELEHANILSQYMISRGGTLVYKDVKAPPFVIIPIFICRKIGQAQKRCCKLR